MQNAAGGYLNSEGWCLGVAQSAYSQVGKTYDALPEVEAAYYILRSGSPKCELLLEPSR